MKTTTRAALFPVAAFLSQLAHSRDSKEHRRLLAAFQYSASDFYPITVCEVCGHAGHRAHTGGCHLWCDTLQHFPIADAYGSPYELFKGSIHTEE